MHTYRYNSPIGSFEIRQVGHLMYELWIEEEMLGSYDSAESAATDVANFDTDYIEWDRFENELENFPKDLGDWTEMNEESPQY
ncbi:hypothetical protein PGH07_02705 [Sulfurovum sp. zt1-1]|uniref:Uncharacterized protein n=1 Tax=Sulfurovum zhangzhouensis TaxID=3019067 RepID=A0ABT7QW74_9BACT|nr:hypothetical protein [Sulfurovum zhangzhouensis]MDM5271084.1 hypothetical protein [Sulfurovum zhangzhouensis]